MRKKVRTFRHWRQQFNKDAAFVFRRKMAYAGKHYEAGDPISEHLHKNKTKLRRFWESKVIELAEFGEAEEKWWPAAKVTEETSAEDRVTKDGRKWLVDGDHERPYPTKTAALEALAGMEPDGDEDAQSEEDGDEDEFDPLED